MKIADLPIQYFEKAKLHFKSNALEPYIDQRTIDINYQYHYQEYIDLLNVLIQNLNLEHLSLDKILSTHQNYCKELGENAGGFFNYSFLWNMLTGNCGGDLSVDFMQAIDNNFGSLEKFKQDFEFKANNLFGSGWTWLIMNQDYKLEILNTPNEINPLMKQSTKQGTPLLAINLWERMYYLKYQSKRHDYISNYWNIIDWTYISNLYHRAMLQKYGVKPLD